MALLANLKRIRLKISFRIVAEELSSLYGKGKTRHCLVSNPMEVILDMKHHLIYASDYEQKVLEIDTDDSPPHVGDYVQLPFGENKEIRRYHAADVYYTPASEATTIFYIEVNPA